MFNVRWAIIIFIVTNHYASLNTEHLQKSHDIHSPLRVKGIGDDQEILGSGYWDVE